MKHKLTKIICFILISSCLLACASCKKCKKGSLKKEVKIMDKKEKSLPSTSINW